ncbi:hypothetical protein Hanom_Chr04g00308871 [Helianthus anomalus]
MSVYNFHISGDVATVVAQNQHQISGNKVVVNLNLDNFVQDSTKDPSSFQSMHEQASSNFVEALGSWCKRVAGENRTSEGLHVAAAGNISWMIKEQI